jgi:predicted HTH transcriptional regulator
MGGLTSATFLTLVFIPALYLFVVERFETGLLPQPEQIRAEMEPLPSAVVEEIAPEKPELKARQKELLERLKTLKKISRKEYAKIFNISIPTAARDLKELVGKGLIEGKGPLGPGRWYEIR